MCKQQANFFWACLTNLTLLSLTLPGKLPPKCTTDRADTTTWP
jgi:hypothetical protein